MRIAVYPGSFDPITNGHMDVIERSAHLFDKVIVAVLMNVNKKPSFSVEERCQMIGESIKHIPNACVESFSGLTVEFARSKNACAIIRGLRAISDYESELAMAALNKRMAPEIETMLLFTSPEWSFISSSLIKEMCAFGGDISGLIPDCIVDKVRRKL